MNLKELLQVEEAFLFVYFLSNQNMFIFCEFKKTLESVSILRILTSQQQSKSLLKIATEIIIRFPGNKKNLNKSILFSISHQLFGKLSKTCHRD